MLEQLILLIDNEKPFLDDFISMAKDSSTRHELARHLECWFTDALEYEKAIVTSRHPSLTFAKSYSFVFQSILESVIQNISYEDWLLMADHYIRKAIESQQ